MSSGAAGREEALEVMVNGEPCVLSPGATVADVLTHLSAPSSGIAVAVNGEIAPRSQWAACVLATGDRVEVLTAAQGG